MLDLHDLITRFRRQDARRYQATFELSDPALRARTPPIRPGSFWIVTGPATARSWVVDAFTAAASASDQGGVVTQSALRTSDAIGWNVVLNLLSIAKDRTRPMHWTEFDLEEIRRDWPWGEMVVAGCETDRAVPFLTSCHDRSPTLLVVDEIASPPSLDDVYARRAWARATQTTVLLSAASVRRHAWDDADGTDGWLRVEQVPGRLGSAQIGFGPPAPDKFSDLLVTVPVPLRIEEKSRSMSRSWRDPTQSR